jgi:uridine kinase
MASMNLRAQGVDRLLFNQEAIELIALRTIMAKILGISGISGAGTTTTTKALSHRLDVTALYWNDFDDISFGPEDYVEWYRTSGDYADWKYPALENTLKELKSGNSIAHPATGQLLSASPLIIFDSSLGRMHKATAQYVDYFIHLDTSMDIALARRIIRDYCDKKDAPAQEILSELEWYLNEGRPLFDATAEKSSADFVVNGDLPTQKIVSIIIHKIGEVGLLA